MRNTLIYTILCVILSPCLWAQPQMQSFDDQLPTEEVFLHIDRDVFIAGQSILLSGYVTTDAVLSNPLSKVMYVELFDERLESLVLKKYKIKEGRTSGRFEIPPNLRSGYYFLRAYTNYAHNFNSDHAYHNVVNIINPEIEGRSIVMTDTTHVSMTEPVASKAHNISLNGLKDSYNVRTKITASIQDISNNIAYGSITVRRKQASMEADPNFSKISNLNPWSSELDVEASSYDAEEFVLPDYRGQKISGIVRDKTTLSPLVLKVCQLSVLGDTPQIHLAMTNDEGRFEFIMNDVYGYKKLHVGLQNEINDRAEILVERYSSLDFPDVNPTLFEYNNDMHEFYNEMVQNSVFDTATYITELPSQMISNIVQFDLTTKTEDFVNFTTIEDMITEIIPFVNVRETQGRKSISVYDPDRESFHYEPLVLLDKVPVYNYEALVALSAKDIERIETITSKHYLGEFPITGIVSITTIEGDFAGYPFPSHTALFDIDMLEYPITHLNKSYTQEEVKNRVPDLRTTLFWSPDETFNEGDSFSFYTGDITGIYEIEICGFDETGKRIYGKEEFEVVHKKQ